MSAKPNRMFAASRPGLLCLRVVGRGNAQGSPALRDFVERHRAADVRQICVDLSECEHLDSTMVGTLVCFAKHPALRAGDGVVLLNPTAECRRVLKQMCVIALFKISESVGPAGQPWNCDQPGFDRWEELPCEVDPHDALRFKQNVVQAHEHLAAVPGPLSDCFREIAEAGKRELEAGKLTETPDAEPASATADEAGER